MSILRLPGRGKNEHADLVREIKQAMNAEGGNFVSKQTTGQLISLESLQEHDQLAIGATANQMINSLTTIATNLGLEHLAAGDNKISMEAGAIAALAFGDVEGYANAAYRNQAKDAPGVRVVDSITAGFAPSDFRTEVQPQFGMEAFDERPLREFLPTSIAFNIYASRQDEFSEAFYPTTVVTPDQGGIDVTVGRMLVFNEVHHQLTGVPANFAKQNLLDAVVDYTILGDELTRLYPYYSTSPSNTQYFVANALVAPSNVTVGGATFQTAPLVMGQRLDLLGLAQVPALIGAGIIDNTDAIDARLSLDAVYLAFPASGSPAVQGAAVRFDTSRLARNTFLKTIEGNYREMGLQFRTQNLVLNAQTTAVDGTTPSAIAGIISNNYSVFLQVNVDGRANTEVGDVQVYSSPISVYAIVDVNGNPVDPTTGAGLAVVNALAGMTLAGYDLRAYRTNSNRRTRGLLLDTTYETERYTIPLGSPLSAPSPITAQRDASDLKALITAARIRNSNNAVTALFAYADTLYAYTTGPQPPTDWNPYDMGIQGMGKFLVKPFYEQHTINLVTAINSITSTERAFDVSATLVNCCRDVSYRMYQQSRYQAALDALTGNPSLRPILLVGTDQVLARHLIVNGDTRTFGTIFDSHRLVVSQDERMYNKIVLTFMRPDAQGPDPLSFGTHAWVPELTSSVMVNRNGATIKEAMVQPRTLHVNNLPVMAVLTVTGLSTVLSETVVFQNNTTGNGSAGTGNTSESTGFPDGTTTGNSAEDLAP
jgi:hypothetical protein